MVGAHSRVSIRGGPAAQMMNWRARFRELRGTEGKQTWVTSRISTEKRCCDDKLSAFVDGRQLGS